MAANGAEPADGTSPGHGLPPIAAAFLVQFDNRKGYTLAWQRTLDKLDIEGVVEFKSLPSGLHNVQEDLVYFVHGEYVGVSAFLNREDEQDDRRARMLAIGVLVPLESGRMGKSWLHAENLKELCRQQTQKADDHSLLEKYWSEHKVSTPASPEDFTSQNAIADDHGIDINKSRRPAGYQLSRSMSAHTVPLPSSRTFPPHHPASALPRFLNLFGPLVLPLYRAALLQKRILFLGEAPVEHTCNFIYNLSILSSIPRGIAESILQESTHDLRLQPLFNVGITDIPALSARKSESDNDSEENPGWIACTTDDVLGTKPDLFDVLVILPNSSSLQSSSRLYPKIVFSNPQLTKFYPTFGLRASQRDARRYATLARGIRRYPSSSPAQNTAIVDEEEGEVDETASTISIASAISRKSIVEPQSWSRIAYTSLIWWASAGDKKAGLMEAEEHENELDTSLLDSDTEHAGSNVDEDEDDGGERSREIAIVSYFHRLTSLIFQVLEDAVLRTDSDNETRYRDDPHDETDVDPCSEARDAGAFDALSTEQARNGELGADDEAALLSSPQRSHDTDSDQMQASVQVSPDDFTSMGLDIWSSADRAFIDEMMKFWFGRQAVITGGTVECCGIRVM